MNSERLLETLVQPIASPKQEDRDVAQKAIEAEIASCGLNPKQIVSAWIESYWKSWLNGGETTINGFPGGLPAIMERNLYTLKRLAYYDKTSPKRLNKDFGITCFGRYDPDMLINQLQTADDTASPYCTILITQNDWNGAAYYDAQIYAQLATSLARTPRPVLTRVFEGDRWKGLLRRLAFANEKYNSSGRNHIAGGIVVAHSDGYKLEFRGFYSHNDRPTVEILDINTVRALTTFFRPGASIVLRSCLTGVQGGIAQELSELGLEVFGTREIAGLQSIKVKVDKRGHPHLFPTYYQAGRVRYFCGQLISNNDPNATLKPPAKR